jgi:acyl carrier protein phosphodiesterase
MVTNDWFGSYRDIDSVAQALDRIAGRIRFPNAFVNAIEDLRRNEELIASVFFQFFPELRMHVESLAFESESID